MTTVSISMNNDVALILQGNIRRIGKGVEPKGNEVMLWLLLGTSGE
jgi:hypothetical protein